MNLKNKLSFAWIAGFYEGEGYCGCYLRRYGKYTSYELTVSITQDDRSICKRIKKFLGYGCIATYKGHSRWVGNGKCALKFLNKILPLMQVKYKINQANKALKLFSKVGRKIDFDI